MKKLTILTLLLTLGVSFADAQSISEKVQKSKSKVTQMRLQQRQKNKEQQKSTPTAPAAKQLNNQPNGSRPTFTPGTVANDPTKFVLPFKIEGQSTATIAGMETINYEGKQTAYKLQLKGTKSGSIYYLPAINVLYLKEFKYEDNTAKIPLVEATKDVNVVVDGYSTLSQTSTIIKTSASVTIEATEPTTVLSFYTDQAAISVGKDLTLTSMGLHTYGAQASLACTGNGGVLRIEGSNIYLRTTTSTTVKGFARVYVTDSGLTTADVQKHVHYDTANKCMIEDSGTNTTFFLSTTSTHWFSGTETTEVVEAFGDDTKAPVFPGGDAAYYQYLNDNIKYPAMAQENNIQGRVTCTFIVEGDGYISNVQVVRSVTSSLDKEAVRVLKSMPRWTPAMRNGKPVRSKYTAPVVFRLK